MAGALPPIANEVACVFPVPANCLLAVFKLPPADHAAGVIVFSETLYSSVTFVALGL